MAGLRSVRKDLTDGLRAGTGLQVYPGLTDQIVGECLVLQPARPFATYQQRMGRAVLTMWHFELVALAGRIALESSQDKLDDLVSPGSRLMDTLWRLRIDGNPVQVPQGTDYGTVPIGTAEYLGARILVDVLAR